MIPIIGGKSDGKESQMKLPRLEIDGEIYMLISYREDRREHFLYMPAGTAPVDAMATFRARLKK